MPTLCRASQSEWPAYGFGASPPALNQAGGIGMSDLTFLAIGGGAFVAFAALAAFLKQV